MKRLFFLPLSFALLFIFSIEQSFAHHALGFATPSNFAQGFFSGIMHPILGFDHFVFLISVGFIAYISGNFFKITLVSILGMCAGVVLHYLGLKIGFFEYIVVSSIVFIGGFLLFKDNLEVRSYLPFENFSLLLIGILLFSLFHGLAFGSSIIGADFNNFFAYLLGLSVIQAVQIFLGKVFMGRLLIFSTNAKQAIKLCGAVVVGVGITYAVEILEPSVISVIQEIAMG